MSRLLTGELAKQLLGKVDSMLDDDDLAGVLDVEFAGGCQRPASYRGYLNQRTHGFKLDDHGLPKAQRDVLAKYPDAYLYSKAKASKLAASK